MITIKIPITADLLLSITDDLINNEKTDNLVNKFGLQTQIFLKKVIQISYETSSALLDEAEEVFDACFPFDSKDTE